jgi:hypothetical protein
MSCCISPSGSLVSSSTSLGACILSTKSEPLGTPSCGRCLRALTIPRGEERHTARGPNQRGIPRTAHPSALPPGRRARPVRKAPEPGLPDLPLSFIRNPPTNRSRPDSAPSQGSPQFSPATSLAGCPPGNDQKLLPFPQGVGPRPGSLRRVLEGRPRIAPNAYGPVHVVGADTRSDGSSTVFDGAPTNWETTPPFVAEPPFSLTRTAGPLAWGQP